MAGKDGLRRFYGSLLLFMAAMLGLALAEDLLLMVLAGALATSAQVPFHC